MAATRARRVTPSGPAGEKKTAPGAKKTAPDAKKTAPAAKKAAPAAKKTAPAAKKPRKTPAASVPAVLVCAATVRAEALNAGFAPLCGPKLRLVEEPGLLARRGENGPVLVLVSPPLAFIAARLEEGLSPAAALDAWADITAQLGKLNKARRKVVLLDDRALEAPDPGLPALLTERLGVAVALPKQPVDAVPAGPARALAYALLSTDPERMAAVEAWQQEVLGAEGIGFGRDDARLAAQGWQPAGADRAALLQEINAQQVSQIEAGMRRIAELEAQLAQGAASEAALDAILGDLAALSSAPDRGLGLALGIALFDALLRAGREDEARAAMGRIEALRAALPGDAAGSLAVQSALAAALARAGGHPLAGWLSECLSLQGPALPGAVDDALETPALYDLLVIVVSCQPYLDSRIPAMQAAWLERLEALGVPWVVAVGGGEGAPRREGHVVTLDAPDDYEGLPQKVLAAFDWALDNSRAGHVLKIDDDCFLDVEAFLQAQSWRKFAYYGRKLTRYPGQTDRQWHQAKSTSERGRREVDKSPEPSTYCDGGSGYVLSRGALGALKARMQTGVGQLLAMASFMEDKLVGDLLAGAGIGAEDEDHLVAIQRRSGGAAKPVSVWSNSFLPSTVSGVKLVHLDSAEGQAEAAALKDRPVLWPRKIWPGYSAPKLIYNSNVLELASPVAKLQAVNAADVSVVAVVRNETFMLPHFLAHYRAMGVESFLVADNLSDDGTLDYLMEQPDVATFSVDSDYRVSHYGVAWQQALLSNFRVNRWSVVADADELLVTGLGDVEPLAGVLAGKDFEDADAARIFMLDLYPEGPLSEARFEAGDPFAEAGFCDRDPFLANWPGQGPFGGQPTWTSTLRHRLIPGARPELFVAQKLALLKYRPWMRLSAGLHFVADVRLARRELVFAHFKYHAEFAAKVRQEVARKQHFNDAEEYRRYLARIGEGREQIHDAQVSVDWRESPAVRRILAG